MPSPRRTPRSAVAPALLALVAVVVLVAGPRFVGPAPAGAQPATTGATAPAASPSPSTTLAPSGGPTPLVARVAPDPAAPVPVRVQGFWVDGGTPDRPVVVVRFAEPFAVPTTPWRVSVSAGDPSGQRVRSSLVSVGTAGVSGRAERGDGTLWDDLGQVGVSAPGDGSVRLELPVGGLPDGSVVWVDAEATEGGRIVTGSTSWFALQDVLGRRSGPSLGVAPVAATDGRSAAPVALPGAGPTVRAVNRALELTTTDPAPTEVDGVAVTDVVDTVEIARPVPGAVDPVALGRTDLILVDRRTGSVQLVPEGGTPVAGVAGTTPWLATGLSSTAPGAPATVTFDLEQLDIALGGPVLDRATTRVGVSRAVTLRDGRVLRTPGVLGTIEWFDDVAFGAPPGAAAPTDDEGGLPLGVLLGAGVAVLAVVVGVVVVVLLVRRRRSTRSGTAGPAPVPRPVEAAPPVADDEQPVPAPDGGRPAPSPARAPAAVPSAEGPTIAAPVAAVGATGPLAVGPDERPDPADPAVASTPLPIEPIERPRRSRRGSPPAAPPADALAAFLAEVDELSARVDRLAERQGPAPAERAAASEADAETAPTGGPDAPDRPDSPGGAPGSVRP